MKLDIKPHWAQDVILKPITKHSPAYGLLDGYVNPGKKFNNTIYMCPKIYNTAEADNIFWHEYRHVLHQREGMFSFYYNLTWLQVKDIVKENPVRWIDRCLEVENDCDDYATLKTGMPFEDGYPPSGVWLYSYAISCMKKQLRAGILTPEQCKHYLTKHPTNNTYSETFYQR